MTAVAAVALLALVVLALLFVRERRGRAAAEAGSLAAAERTALVAEVAREAVGVFGRDHTPVLLNAAFGDLTGYDAGALAAQAPLLYVLPDDRPPLLADLADLLEQRSAAPRTRECRLVKPGGDVRWCTLTLAPAPGSADGYAVAITDRTAARAAEERLRRDAELLRAVVEVEQAVATAGLDADAVMHVIAERCRELTHADGASVLLRDGELLVVRVSVGVPMPGLPVQGSLAGQAIRTGDVALSNDVATDTIADRSAWLPLGIRSLLAAPLMHDGRVVGALKVASQVPGAFGDDDARALRQLTGMLGAALAHAAAFEARQQRLEERTRALQESEQRFKQLVDTAQEGIWVLDERGVGTYLNPRLAELFGYPAGEMLGRPMVDFMDAPARAEAQPLLDRAGSAPLRADVRFRRRDGGELWTLAAVSSIVARDGGPVGSVVMVSDITDRKRAEDRLLSSAERLRTLHEMHRAILSADSPADVARAALVRLGRLVPCRRCSVVLFDGEGGAARLVAGLEAGVPLPEQQIPLERLSPGDDLRRGTIRSIEDLEAADVRPPIYQQLRAAGIRSLLSIPLTVDGETIGELNLGMSEPGGVAPEQRDIAVEVATPLAVAMQHARLRDELAGRTAELERRIVEHTAALRQSRADTEALELGLAHDLREPLRHLQGFAQLLVDEHGDGLAPEARHYAGRIADAARELATLVEGLTRLARVGRQELLVRPVDLGLIADEVVLEARTAANGRSVEWDVERLPRVSGDASLLRDAIRELVDNALRFSGSRSLARITIRPLATDGEVGITVEDNGIGFPPDQSPRLFRAFERLHERESEGRPGLGLAVVQRIAQRHGGRVWADAVPGAGAAFHLALPAPGTAWRPEP